MRQRLGVPGGGIGVRLGAWVAPCTSIDGHTLEIRMPIRDFPILTCIPVPMRDIPITPAVTRGGARCFPGAGAGSAVEAPDPRPLTKQERPP